MKKYLVGGAVRDEIMGKTGKDRDWVVVGATGDDMLALGFKQVGADFPVFLHHTTGEEYALARTERKTGGGYLGFSVETEGVTLADDLSRRDLTMNSIAKDEETGEYIDPYGGLEDIKNKIIRHTSDAFSEDPLRVIRVARFAARYPDFKIHPDTFELMIDVVRSGSMNELPPERYWAELYKSVTPHWHRFFDVLFDVEAIEYVNFFRATIAAPRQVISRLARAAIHVEFPVEILVGWFAESPEKLVEIRASSALIKHTQHSTQLARINNLDDIYEFLKAIRSWSAYSDVDLMLKAMMVYQAAYGTSQRLTFMQLTKLVDVVRAITIKDIDQKLTGADIGAALEQLRRAAVSRHAPTQYV